jgi:hypothetical protein
VVNNLIAKIVLYNFVGGFRAAPSADVAQIGYSLSVQFIPIGLLGLFAAQRCTNVACSAIALFGSLWRRRMRNQSARIVMLKTQTDQGCRAGHDACNPSA